jgi:hypothetical protein
VPRASLTCAYGAIGSGTIYVNLAAYHVKSVRSSLSSRASGMFVTSLYAAASVAGYLMGGIASHAGWALAGEFISLLSAIAGSLALKPCVQIKCPCSIPAEARVGESDELLFGILDGRLLSVGNQPGKVRAEWAEESVFEPRRSSRQVLTSTGEEESTLRPGDATVTEEMHRCPPGPDPI